MPDREMIKESIIRAVRNGAKNEELRLIIDELLREQEPVEPNWRCSTVYMNGTGKIELICGNCGVSIPLGKPNYCPWCGRKVKWNA